MNVVIRADASREIGSGHVMRCLTLADAIVAAGAEVSFISRVLSGDLNGHIEKKGYSVHRICHLPGDTDTQNSSVGSLADAEQTRAILAAQKSKTDWLIVDHYGLARDWESEVRPYVGKIMVIDDLANRQHDCDLLLDQNYYGENDPGYDELVPARCKKLIGTSYTLLRPEFAAALSVLEARTGRLERILVFFGASDSENETLKALRAIRLVGEQIAKVDVVLGINFPFKAIVRDFAATMPQVECHDYVDNMAQLIATADLYLGAAGTTTWERCCLGLPSLVIAVAANQVEPIKRLEQAGVVRYLGEGTAVSSEDIAGALREILANPAALQEISRKAMKLVDGRGAQRCVREILSKEIAHEEAVPNYT